MKNKMLASVAILMLLTTIFMVSTTVKADPAIIHVPEDYETITLAIAAANPGDTIIVAAGTYDEQVIITKSLTLQGAGNTTIIQPSGTGTLTSSYTLGTQAGAFWNGYKLASIISVENVGTAGVIVKNLKVDGVNVNGLPVGADYVVGISYGETTGTIDDVTVVNMNNVPIATRTYGMWLDAVSTSVSVEVKNSSISYYNKNGITARGAHLTVNIHDNIIVGPGTPGTQVPNGIVLAFGCGGTVSYNEISSHHYTEGIWLSCGIMGYDAKDGVIIEHNEVYDNDVGIAPSSHSTIYANEIYDCYQGIELEAGSAYNDINGNQIHDNDYGIHLLGPGSPYYTGLGDEPGPGNKANYNNIYDNTEGVRNWDTTQTFDARFNWWGDPFGPTASPPAGDKVSGYVDYAPWLIEQYPPAVLVPKLYVDPETKEVWTPAECTEFNVTIVIEGVPDLYGFEFKLTWNSSLINLVKIHVKVDQIWTNYFIAHNETWHGPDCTDWYWLAASATAPMKTGFDGTAILVELTFHIKYDPCYPDACSTPIHFVDVKLSDSYADPIPIWVQDGLYQIRSSKPKLEIKPASTTINKYQDFPVEIWLRNATKVYSYAFEVCYNTTILDVANVVIHQEFLPGPYLIKSLQINEIDGSVRVELQEADNAPPANGDGLLVTITFRVTEVAIWKKGQNNTLYSLIEFESWKLDVKCPEPRILEGDLVGIENAEYWFMPVLGDVNSDGVVNVVDLRMVAMKWGSTAPEILKLVDLNCDSNVDIYDLVLVAKQLTS